MEYTFGDYKIKTKYKKYIFSSDWISVVYYKDSWFKTCEFNISEARALDRARIEIAYHKQALRNLSNV